MGSIISTQISKGKDGMMLVGEASIAQGDFFPGFHWTGWWWLDLGMWTTVNCDIHQSRDVVRLNGDEVLRQSSR
ncbi:hypothetical protein F1880_005279 [Penicillium rolfsii]|nr:hypothetical protein F1880_005279 [Penicillium rolfsii]